MQACDETVGEKEFFAVVFSVQIGQCLCCGFEILFSVVFGPIKEGHSFDLGKDFL